MASLSDPAVQAELLKDPRVQEAVKKAGQQALNDPKVQAQILETCKDKFPGLANDAKDQVTKWANDPEVQAQAQQYAGVALDYAKQGAAQAAGMFVHSIEQGPAGIRFLAFCGGCASCGNAGMTLMGLLNPLTWVTSCISYVICGYQVIFALTTMLFEAPPEYIEKFPLPGINGYHDTLCAKAKFLSEVGGRGLFYLFQGTLWLAFASLTKPVNLGVGLYLVLIAFFHIAMHFGIMPQQIAQKARQGMGGYIPLPPPSDNARELELAGAMRDPDEDNPTVTTAPPAAHTPAKTDNAFAPAATEDAAPADAPPTVATDAAAEDKEDPAGEPPKGKKGGSCCVVS